MTGSCMMAPPITVWIALPTRLLMSTEMEIQTGLVTLAPQQGRSVSGVRLAHTGMADSAVPLQNQTRALI